jgi:hypothetical protein
VPTRSVHLYFVVVADQENFIGISLDLIIVQFTTIILDVAIHWTPDFPSYLSSIRSGIHIVFQLTEFAKTFPHFPFQDFYFSSLGDLMH